MKSNSRKSWPRWQPAFWLALTGCCLILSGCALARPEIDGYVVAVKDREFLVTSYDAAAGRLACNSAIWFSGAPKGIEVGQRVRVWTNAVAQSFPAQATADRCKILSANRPKGSALTEAEAVRKALEKRKAEGWPFITTVKYDDAAQMWKIQFAGGPDGKLDTQPISIPCKEK